jgi:hypothetical protein
MGCFWIFPEIKGQCFSDWDWALDPRIVHHKIYVYKYISSYTFYVKLDIAASVSNDNEELIIHN